MENATKALIIAAAILIAIVLISLGVYVLGIGQQSIQGADMSETEIMAFNSKFDTYVRNRVMGSEINVLLRDVAANNLSEGADGRQIRIDGAGTYSGDTGTITQVTHKARTGNTYNVTATKNEAGLITVITIEGN